MKLLQNEATSPAWPTTSFRVFLLQELLLSAETDMERERMISLIGLDSELGMANTAFRLADVGFLL